MNHWIKFSEGAPQYGTLIRLRSKESLETVVSWSRNVECCSAAEWRPEHWACNNVSPWTNTKEKLPCDGELCIVNYQNETQFEIQFGLERFHLGDKWECRIVRWSPVPPIPKPKE